MTRYDYTLQRFSSDTDSTLGILSRVTPSKNQFLAFTLEDEYREVKVMHETRIPAGVYEIRLRAAGGMHARYKKTRPYHKGMLHLQDVQNFTWIYIHPGCTDDHTSGCLLVANECRENVHQSGRLRDPEPAYERIYKEMANHLQDGDQVFIEIVDGG